MRSEFNESRILSYRAKIHTLMELQSKIEHIDAKLKVTVGGYVFEFDIVDQWAMIDALIGQYNSVIAVYDESSIVNNDESVVS